MWYFHGIPFSGCSFTWSPIPIYPPTADTVLRHEYIHAPESHMTIHKRYSINFHYHIEVKTEGSTMREEIIEKEYNCELYNAGFYVNERPQVCDEFQKSNEIENSENLVIKDDIRAVEGVAFGIIISIPIWILIISFIEFKGRPLVF